MQRIRYRICLKTLGGGFVDLPIVLNDSGMSLAESASNYKAEISDLEAGGEVVLIYRVCDKSADSEPAVVDHLIASTGYPTALIHPFSDKITILSIRRSRRICQTSIFT